MKQTKWHFRLHDGKGGIIICPYPKSQKEVEADCRERFGEERLREVTHG